MKTAQIEAACIKHAYEYFASKLIGMVPDSRLPLMVPSDGIFSALSDEFAGKFWEIEGFV